MQASNVLWSEPNIKKYQNSCTYCYYAMLCYRLGILLKENPRYSDRFVNVTCYLDKDLLGERYIDDKRTRTQYTYFSTNVGPKTSSVTQNASCKTYLIFNNKEFPIALGLLYSRLQILHPNYLESVREDKGKSQNGVKDSLSVDKLQSLVNLQDTGGGNREPEVLRQIREDLRTNSSMPEITSISRKEKTDPAELISWWEQFDASKIQYYRDEALRLFSKYLEASEVKDAPFKGGNPTNRPSFRNNRNNYRNNYKNKSPFARGQ